MADKLDVITALIAKANGTDNPHERETYLAKADALMFKYKIDAAMVEANAAGKSLNGSLSTPTHEKIEWVEPWDEFFDIHASVVASLQYLTGVMVVQGYRFLDVFGYASDIRYFRELWTAMFLQFSSKLDPKWDTVRSDGENIKLLIESGQKWVPVWEAGRRAGALEDVKRPPEDNGKMKRLYQKECRRQGVEKMKLTFKVEDYRSSFALGYRDVVWQRCIRLKAQREMIEREQSDGVSMVLRSQVTAIEDLMNKVYPSLTYGSADDFKREGNNSAAREIGARAARDVDMAGTKVGGDTPGARGAIEG